VGVELEESLSAFAAEVALEGLGVGVEEVDQDEAVEDVGEAWIHIEGEEAAAEVEVVAEEDGDGAAAGLEVFDEGIQVVDAGQEGGEAPDAGGDVEAGPEGLAGLDERGEGGVRAVCFEVSGDQFARDAGIGGADADGAEEVAALGVLDDEPADGLPEEGERVEVALVFRTHKRAAEFDGGAEVVKESGVEAEQGGGIEAGGAAAEEEGLSEGEAVGAGNLAALGIPEEDVGVGLVEGVEVEGCARPFAGEAEGELAEAADFAESERDFGSRGEEGGESAGCGEAAVRGQGLDFGAKGERGGRRGKRLWAAGRPQERRAGRRGPPTEGMDPPTEVISDILLARQGGEG
jgi:hypothetical protein